MFAFAQRMTLKRLEIWPDRFRRPRVARARSRCIRRVADACLASLCDGQSSKLTARAMTNSRFDATRQPLVEVAQNPRQRSTGKGGYFLKRGSVLARSHSQNSLPFAERIVRACTQSRHRPMRARRSRSVLATRDSARRDARIAERPDAAEAHAHHGRIITTNDRAVAALFDQGTLRNAGSILKAHARAFLERREHAHVIRDGVQIGGGFVDVSERVHRRASHPAGIGEHVHFLTAAEEHDAGCAGVQEANDSARLEIGARSPAEPCTHGFERRLGPWGARVVYRQRNATRHAPNLALRLQNERCPHRLCRALRAA